MENLGISVSLLGYGCMRFPTTKDGDIDQAESEKLIDLAYENGVRYFDTAYFYHGGQSETFIGKALAKYDRGSYFLATKLPGWGLKTLDDAKRIFNEQLKKLDKDYVDFYLLHSLGKSTWDSMVRLGVLEYIDELREEGKIRYFGFSFHDEYKVFEEIITARKWDFCQIQLNYMDVEEQAGLKGYRLAESLGVPVIIMEPVKGGQLANLPDDITEEFRRFNPDASVASWALRWAASLPNVKVVLSGMSTMQQVRDNLDTFSGPNALSGEEQETVRKVSDLLNQRVNNGCTGCSYCMPCPKGVNIPYNFKIWNTYGIYKNKGSALWRWKNELKEDEKAASCASCGLCEKVCPQKIRIRDDLSRLQKEFDSLE